MSNPNFTPPVDDAGWDAACVAAGLHLKWHNEVERPAAYGSSQLELMLLLHTQKLARFADEANAAEALLESLSLLPAGQQNKLEQSGAYGKGVSKTEYQSLKMAWATKRWTLDEIVQLITNEIRLRESGFVTRSPVGTKYWGDSDNGSDSNDGLGTGSGNAWDTLSKYTANARSAGDLYVLRRGRTANYGTGSISVTSDGTIAAPIVVEADYDDEWGDFSNSSQTYTLVHGSKTHTASATITGIAAGDWIYNTTDSDDPRLLSYEVASVSGTTLTLVLPFKGTTGSGKTLKRMPPAPVFGAGGSTDLITFSSDRHWIVRGIEFYGDHSSGQVSLNSSVFNLVFHDVVLHGGGASTDGVTFQSGSVAKFFKTHIYGYSAMGIENSTGGNFGVFVDCLIDGTGGGGRGLYVGSNMARFEFTDCEFLGNSTADIDAGSAASISCVIRCRNCLFGSTVGIKVDQSSVGEDIIVYSEDHDGVIGDHRIFSSQGSADDDTPLIQTDTGTVRSGGSATSLKLTPGDNLGVDPCSLFGLVGDVTQSRDGWFELYADTTSRTYTFYVKTNATSNWTANPTADELFIEAMYWGHASNNFHCVKRSTATVSLTTLTTWQAIAITVAPAQAGKLFLRLVYGKAKESAKSNELFIDPDPVVS